MGVARVGRGTVGCEIVIETEADEDQPQAFTAEGTQAPFVGVPGVTFTVRDAARACAVHANTVRRRLKAGEFPNAFRDHTGTWRIPVADLEAAGLRPQRSREEMPPRDVVVIPEASTIGLPTMRETYEALRTLEDEADEMRATIDDLHRRAAFAETLAQERADRIEDLRMALRALEAVNPRPQERLTSVPAPDAPKQGEWAAESSPRRSRWRWGTT
jgi:hypothetical protein